MLKPRGGKKSREDYIEFCLTDSGQVLDPMGRLREVYPNTLSVRRLALEREALPVIEVVSPNELSVRDLFARFFKDVAGDPLSKEEVRAVDLIIEEVGREEVDA